jgi:CDP-diacylglycerol--glycerol-3-phosphate 3-phosphatidyltransferase
MTISDKLTLSRVFIAPYFALWSVCDNTITRLILLILLVAGCVTDWLDGYIARRANQVSDFGKVMDPLTDKILICSLLIAFAVHPELSVPAWMVILIIWREFSVTGLREMGLLSGKKIPAAMSGKIKTVLQMVFLVVVALALYVSGVTGYGSAFLKHFSWWGTLILVIISLASAIEYLLHWRIQ